MQKIYSWVITVFLWAFSFNSFAQTFKSPSIKKEAAFLKTCDAIAKAYLKRDIKKINSFIHPKKGIYVLYRPSMLYWYMHVNKLTENYSAEQYESNKILIDSTLLDCYFPNKDSVQIIRPVKFDSKIKFDCEWNQFGSFVDSLHTPSRISSIIQNYIYVEQGSITPDELKEKRRELKKIKSFEKKSRLVVFNEFKNHDLVFYMTLIDNKWYLSVLDCISDYCEVW